MRLAVVDTERCVDCQSCMFACVRRQDDVGLARTCINVRSVGGMERGFVVIVCRACDDPPCAKVCPTGALKPRKKGGVRFDIEKCNGCGHCRDACLIGAIFWDDEINKPMICIHCGYCVKFCPHGVLRLEKREALGHGVEHAASLYGGQDYALSFGGNEMPGYHTGPGAHIGVLTGARHSHLDNAGYSVDQKALIKKQLSPEKLAEALLAEEHWRQILSGLVICFFARGIYKPDTVLKTLQLAGFNLTPEDLCRIGEDIHRAKYRFKIREGFSLDNLRLPKRIFETPSSIGKLDEEYIRKTIEHFKQALFTK